MTKPTVYLVGAGPGDSGLITVRGLELIKNADCIIYDYLVNPDLLEVKKDNCELIYVGKKAGAHTLTQDKINELLVKKTKAHANIVRLKGGDPFVFGRGAEEALYLKKNKVTFEIVPGVTSAIAVPAYAGIPVTERGSNSTVGFITGHEDPSKESSAIDWKALTKALGTMVFLMGVGNLDSIAKKLVTSGKPKDTPVSIISQGATARQKTITGTLGNIAGLARKNKMSAPAIIVVGEVVKLRDELNWFEKMPLFGKRIIVTRAREQASLLSEKLTRMGSEVIEIPTIKIVPQRADKQIKEALLSGRYDWVFFTSQNGVSEFAAFLERTGKDSRIFGKARICAIGSETAKSLRGIGIKPDYVPPKFVAEEVVKHFARHCEKGEARRSNLNDNLPICSFCSGRALILRAKKARDVLPAGLRKAGFDVKIIDLYDTVIPAESVSRLKEAFKEKIDFITFTSSSTVENFIKLLGKNYGSKLHGVKLASIGPVTSATIRRFSLKVYREAETYTIDGLVEVMAKRS